jgi:hypothetical protein
MTHPSIEGWGGETGGVRQGGGGGTTIGGTGGGRG